MEKALLRYLLETANRKTYSFFEVRNNIVFVKEGSTGLEREYTEEMIKKLIDAVFRDGKKLKY